MKTREELRIAGARILDPAEQDELNELLNLEDGLGRGIQYVATKIKHAFEMGRINEKRAAEYYQLLGISGPTS